uniref:Uncharacterized protein n=1 Tax=Hucho hucho TaxID=62062 RepID=A0A4W5RXP6_9TELE
MLEPLGKKTVKLYFDDGIPVKCPSKTSPFVRTYVNSNYTYEEPAPTPPPITNWGSDFSCVALAPSTSVPTSVHKLRPGDIKVVAALGDSNTVSVCVCVCVRMCLHPCMSACRTKLACQTFILS